jgi:Tfp pilus assembly protein PilO
MGDPMLPIRGDNGRARDVLFDAPRTKRRGSVEISPLAVALVPTLLAAVVAALISWGGLFAANQARDSTLGRLDKKVEMLETAQQTSAVEAATLAAEVRTELRGIATQLAEINKRLDRIEAHSTK